MLNIRIFGTLELETRSNLDPELVLLVGVSEISEDLTCVLELQRLLPNRRSRTKLRRFDHLRQSRRDRNLGLGVRDVELSRRSLAASLHEIYLLFGLLTKAAPHLSALGSGFEAASEPVSAFQIRKSDDGSDAAPKPPPRGERWRTALVSKPNNKNKINLMQTRERTPTQFYVPNTKSEIAISSTLKELIESSKFRSPSAIRKKPLKFKARQIFTDLGNPYLQNELKLKVKIASSNFDCSKDPDVVRAADLLMELSSSASSASSAPPIWSDEMYSWPQPEVVRLKMRGMPEICVS